ncbi:hypothetical protein PRN20_04590 [Devosia sp. ZB163]|uniref:hypothetical protein n=1 Tax=Devosia sp. ZB163 TaxID=3025938 RepID=UPI00235F3A88|nr:hypothetical protein [Devosia sp. ZB163]MDC9823000.1 hypothetical protein [Devosia sp. ZB163]
MALTPTSTFSDVMRVTQFSDQSHKDKALKSSGTDVLYQKSSFNTAGEIKNKQSGATYIQKSLDREYGAGFGAKVFTRANTYQPGLNLDKVVKGRDLVLLDRAAANLRAEDTVANLRAQLGNPARGISGAQTQSLLQLLGDGRVGTGKKMEAEVLLREAIGSIGTLSGMKATLQPLSQAETTQLLQLRQGNGNATFSLVQQEMIKLAPGSGGNTAQNRATLLTQLPPGATVGQDGTIGGTTTLNTLGGIFPGQTGLPAPRFVDVMKFIGDSQLGKTGETLSNGVTIGSQANKDLYRMNITITNGTNPPYNSVTERTNIERQHGADQVPTRTNLSVANAMMSVSGNNANVVRVLSSVINQQFSTPLCQGFRLQNGQDFKPNIANSLSEPNGVQLGGNDTVSLVHPGGIGRSQVNISKQPNGDYRVDISYPFTMRRPSTNDHNSSFAGLGGTVIQGTANASFTIDGTQAGLGKLMVVENGSPTVTWNGHMI